MTSLATCTNIDGLCCYLQFNFVVEEAQTDTTVVPRGVVAAMKALREKRGITEGMSVLVYAATVLEKVN